MDTWTIEGGTPLRGEVRVSGAKRDDLRDPASDEVVAGQSVKLVAD